MHIDIPSLMMMESFAYLCAGAILFIAWLGDQETPALALWALADVASASGILSIMLGTVTGQPLWVAFGGPLLPLAAGLVWKAVRSFETKWAPLPVALLGTVFVAVLGGVPALRNFATSLPLAVGIVYFFLAAATLWSGRKEGLAARGPITILTIVNAVTLMIGIYGTLHGTTGPDRLPPVLSLFGIVHFEAIVFAVGTAVFLLALVKERKEAASTMAARTDGLTGIANRAAFMDSGERVIERCRHEKAPASVLMFDLDHFKAVNDTFGHAVGDDVIRKFSEVAGAALLPNDVFGRIGGEEFAVVLPGVSLAAATVRADRIRALFAENCRVVSGRPVEATVSGGVSVSEDASHELSALLECADVALYRAKVEGRNRIHTSDQPRQASAASNVLRVA